MQYFGKISYGLYVWHMLAIVICYEIGVHNFIINLVLTFLITVFLAHISYNYFEKVFLKFK
jgi:peptidoglycan/LPS O-acetylase OafA/YrhL